MKAWKRAELDMARDMGTQRIPVTGERFGADFQDGLCWYQLKKRQGMPGLIREWLESLRAISRAHRGERIPVFVWMQPHMRRADALVVLRWADWRELHGPAEDPLADMQTAPLDAPAPVKLECTIRGVTP